MSIVRKLILVLACLPLLAGCALPDLLFTFLGDYYSAGGETRAAKKLHYDRQIEAIERPHAWTPEF